MNTFGLKRAQILAAIFNSVLLIIVSLFLMKEAVVHLVHPAHVEAGLMMIVGGFGLIANLLGTFLLCRDSADNINIRASHLHFETHVDVGPEVAVRDTTELRKDIVARLSNDFCINHVTLQFECGLCGRERIGVRIGIRQRSSVPACAASIVEIGTFLTQ